MFGGMDFSSIIQALMAQKQGAKQPGGGSVDALLRQQELAAKDEYRRNTPGRWQGALETLGAGFQDAASAHRGQSGTALDSLRTRQQEMAEARDEARRRQMRLQHFRDTIPEHDETFWQAYSLGGEEAALAALQNRTAREHDRSMMQGRHAFQAEQGALDRRFQAEQGGLDRDQRDRLAAESSTPQIVRLMEVAGIKPDSPVGQQIINNALNPAEAAPGSPQAVAARILSDIMARGDSEPNPQERQILNEIAQLSNTSSFGPMDIITMQNMGIDPSTVRQYNRAANPRAAQDDNLLTEEEWRELERRRREQGGQ